MHVMKYLHCNYYIYTCGIRINAKLVKEGSFRINAKLVKEELMQIKHSNVRKHQQFGRTIFSNAYPVELIYDWHVDKLSLNLLLTPDGK